MSKTLTLEFATEDMKKHFESWLSDSGGESDWLDFCDDHALPYPDFKINNKVDTVLEKLEDKATTTHPEDDSTDDEPFNAMDYYGQYDDAYEGGADAGEIRLARSLREELK